MRPSFLKVSSSITSSKFSHIFIRPFLSNETILTGKIYFHAYKSSLTKHKCIFNRRSAHYELRLLAANDSHLDWKATPYIPSTDELEIWNKSLKSYKIDKTQKSISNWLINQDLNSLPLYKPTLQQYNNHNPILKYILENARSICNIT